MFGQYNPEEMLNYWGDFFTSVQKQHNLMASSYIEELQKQMPLSPTLMPDMFLKASQAIIKNPAQLLEAQENLLDEIHGLWGKALFPEEETQEQCDKRFRHEAWESNPYFIFLKGYYLVTSRWLKNLISEIDGIDEETKAKLTFYTHQFVEAVSPTNFPLTNPEVLEELIKTDGVSLHKGLQNLLDDASKGKWMKMTDPDAFKLGETLATTKGDVIYRNDLFELIHYHPLTEKQFKVPLLIIPPWINKYYIFDLSPKNSFVKWMLEKGHNVFIVSWVNPGSHHANKSFEDYLLNGAYKACERVAHHSKSQSINAMGYCVGGNLLTALSAYLAKVHSPFKLRSLTLLTTIMDFAKVGDLKVFIDEEHLQYLEDLMAEHGFLDAEKMKSIFSMLRPNELVWSFFVKNYLLGQIPPAFDFLYWNSDSTRLPMALHRDILRKCFQQNLLLIPGGMTIKDIPLDVRDITTPTMFLSTIEDHISPWKSSYPAVHNFKGPLEFVLAGSGHVAGVMNPPEKNKYGFFTNSMFPFLADEWLASASQQTGSWWTYWHDWIAPLSGNAMSPSLHSYPSLAPAPGEYVLAR